MSESKCSETGSIKSESCQKCLGDSCANQYLRNELSAMTKKVEERDALISMQVEALKTAANDLRGYNNQTGAEYAEKAISASAESVAAWEAEKLLPLRDEIAELQMELDCTKNRVCSEIAALCAAGMDFIEKSNQSIPMVEIQAAEDKLRFVISNTQATTEAYDREHTAKAKETAIHEYLIDQMNRDYSAWPNQEVAQFMPEFFHRLHAEFWDAIAAQSAQKKEGE